MLQRTYWIYLMIKAWIKNQDTHQRRENHSKNYLTLDLWILLGSCILRKFNIHTGPFVVNIVNRIGDGGLITS